EMHTLSLPDALPILVSGEDHGPLAQGSRAAHLPRSIAAGDEPALLQRAEQRFALRLGERDARPEPGPEDPLDRGAEPVQADVVEDRKSKRPNSSHVS